MTESFTLTSPDGTASHTINVQIHGHDDTPSLSVNEGGAGKSLDLLGGLSSGTVSHMQFSTDGVHYTNQVPDGFMLAGDGHTLQVDPAHHSYNHLANGIALKVDIKYELQQGAGSNVQTSQQQAQVVVTGTSDRPIIHSFNPHSQQNNGPVTGNLLQGATDVDDGAQLVLHDVQFQDPITHQYVTVQAGQTHNINGVGVIAISATGDYSFTPNSQFSGQVPNLIYRVTDTNGDYADNSQNNLTIHIDPYQAPMNIAPLAAPASDMHDVPHDYDSTIVIDDIDVSANIMAHQDAANDPADIHHKNEDVTETSPMPLSDSPIDHYLQMVGLSHQDMVPAIESPTFDALPGTYASNNSNIDIDMLDTSIHDHFENPLQDDDMEHHKNHDFDLIDEPIIEHDSQSNDDLLHSALNSMHNQT